jgi:hypothetical protein
MRRGAQVARRVHRVIDRTYTVGCKRTWIRDVSEQISLSMSALPPELLRLLNSRLRMQIDLSVDKCKSFVGLA